MIISEKNKVFERQVMKKQESLATAGYEASSAEIKSVIIEWVEATEAFHRRYAKLTEVINALQTTSRRQPNANKGRLNRLISLRKHMSDVLMTLLLDMTGQKPGHLAMPSKPGQLHSHACLLDELNREIDAELIQATTVAQA